MFEIMIISFSAGLTTVLGACLTLVIGRSTDRVLAGIMGLASGVMLGVVFLDLLPSSFKLGGMWHLLLGVVSGGLFVWLLAQGLGVKRRGSLSGNGSYLIKLGYLVAMGIALHDLPEGMAIAVGYAATPQLGWLIAVAIGLHNVPEGMAMAAPLLMGGQSPRRIIAIAALVSLVTPIGAALGLCLVHLSSALIAYLLAFAGGSMLYIVLRELLPAGMREHPPAVTLGVLLGLLLVFLLSALE